MNFIIFSFFQAQNYKKTGGMYQISHVFLSTPPKKHIQIENKCKKNGDRPNNTKNKFPYMD